MSPMPSLPSCSELWNQRRERLSFSFRNASKDFEALTCDNSMQVAMHREGEFVLTKNRD